MTSHTLGMLRNVAVRFGRMDPFSERTSGRILSSEQGTASERLLRAARGARLRSLTCQGFGVTYGVLRSCLRTSSVTALDISGFAVEREDMMDAIADCLPTSLQSLSINSGYVHEPGDEDPWPISCFRDHHLCAVASKALGLKVLSLTMCPDLTDASVGPALAALSELQSLNISYCDSTTDIGLSAVASRDLRHLKLDGLPFITDESVDAILARNRSLFSIDLRDTQVSDAIIPRILDLRARLTSLVVSRTAVTWPGLRLLFNPPNTKLICLGISYLAGAQDDVAHAVPCLGELRVMGHVGSVSENLIGAVTRLRGTLRTLTAESAVLVQKVLELLVGDGVLTLSTVY
ncbi:hypothetical protein DFJ74DRAFT_709956 [Hyaloraphidium curvatum]|nr:hypothetical protein DFJ74DRAFT_709956 [Hyaloraphidium curvatum]